MEPQASWKEETDSTGSQGGSEHRLGRHAESASDPSGAAHQHRALEHTSVTEPRSALMLKGKEVQDRTPHLLGIFVGGLNRDTGCDVLRKAPGAKEAALRAKSSPHWRVWDASLKIQPKGWEGTLARPKGTLVLLGATELPSQVLLHPMLRKLPPRLSGSLRKMGG